MNIAWSTLFTMINPYALSRKSNNASEVLCSVMNPDWLKLRMFMHFSKSLAKTSNVVIGL